MFSHISSLRLTLVASLGIAAVALSGCNGSTSSVLGGLTGNGYVRVLDGSPDAGNVDIAIDNNVVLSNASYGSLTRYFSVTGGTNHAIHIYAAGSDTGNGIFSGSIAENSGADYTVVFSGELHPSYQAAANVGFITFAEQPFSGTPSGGGALNFHHAAPFAAAATGLNQSTVQFGYSVDNFPANNTVGTPQSISGMTNPVGLPSNAVGTPITLYAVNNATVTTTPGAVSSSCSSNQIPCTTPNLSLYLVDGPAASLTPSAPPAGVSLTAKAALLGVFDGNGLLTQ
ncbi:MAG TPA: DUF4397 domain-containing protein [Candidatus Baltobacteraceae bacterium]